MNSASFRWKKADGSQATCELAPWFGMILLSHYSAIGDTISCDAPYSAIGFRGKLFLQSYPPSKACLWIAIGHFYGKKRGVAAIVCDHSATGVLLHLSRDRGVFGRVTKEVGPLLIQNHDTHETYDFE